MKEKLTNDDKILALKQQIQDKKQKIRSAEKFVPLTNCSLELYGVRYNIRTLNEENAFLLLSRLYSCKVAATNLNIPKDIKISGYQIEEWIKDLQSYINQQIRKKEEQKLRSLESKLELLLSQEKKTELEINEIESLLED